MTKTTPVVVVTTPEGDVEVFQTLDTALDEVGSIPGWRWIWADSRNRLDCARGCTVAEIREWVTQRIRERSTLVLPLQTLWVSGLRHVVLRYVSERGVEGEYYTMQFSYLYY